MRTTRALRGLGRAVLLGSLAVGCGSDSPSPKAASLDAPAFEPRSPTATAAPCQTGDVQACSITLSQHDGVLNCYHGQQVCADGSWSDCGSGEVSSIPAPGEPLRGTVGLHYLAITGAEGCDDNPCDPSCLQIEAADGNDTSTLSGNLGSFKWQTGNLQSFPGGLVSKGMKEPCVTGADCQMDTRCMYPVTTACAHSKCATGAALEPSCDPCVADICAVDASCCPQAPVAPPSCAHSPCVAGGALDPACDPCVTAICLSQPSCCTGTWDAACQAAVVSVCGNSCQCAAGEIAYDGQCYVKEEADLSWTAARTACQARGSGWDLLSVNDGAENDFVTASVIDNSETWLGLTDGNGIGTNGKWKWARGTPNGTYDESANGQYGATVIVPFAASWRYLANNVEPAGSWNTAGFNDSSWTNGNAQLGFGDGDEVTSFPRNGPSYYFRHSFTLTKLPSAAQLDMLYDDGFVAYVNGVEVRRVNVSNAAHASYASTSSSDDDTDSSTFAVTPFVIGTNVLAVVVKNRSVNNVDLSFDAQLTLTMPDDRTVGFGTAGWKYYSAASAPPAAWYTSAFNDSGWSNGTGQLGFGEGDEATAFTKTGASYYFRRQFTLTQPLTNANLSVLFDDGFVAYVNGVEVRRRNVSDVAHTAYGSATAENEIDTTAVSTTPFVVGTNVLAVQVKNRSSASNDLSFDAQLDTRVAGNTMYANFGSGEPDAEACARFDANRVGTWGDRSCVQQTDSVCEGPPSEMIGGGGVPLWGAWGAIPYGSSWKYRNNLASPGNTWNTTGFNDSLWATGVGQLGYGEGDESTSFGATNPSYYFRKTVNIPTAISDATLSVIFDDGFVVYVNGTEAARRNVASTDHSAYATTSSGDNDSVTLPIATTPFVTGNNTIAVVVKNSSNSSSDISFDLKLDVTLCGAGGCPAEPAWSQSCIDKVATVCDATCDTRSPPASTGQCEPWYPGEKDPTCAGIDLTVGLTCDGTIPVCNHGMAVAPAGIKVMHFPANSQQFNSASPNTAHPQAVTCTTTEPILPGQCISMTGCAGLNGNREILANPPGAGQLAECSTKDNWGLYSNGKCGEPTCDGGSSVATLTKKPVDIIIAIDNSGSMKGEILQVQQRINEDFAQIIEASGVDYRVIMMSRYGDVDTSVGGSDYPICVSSPLGGHDCSNPIGQGVSHNAPRFYHFSTDVGSRDSLCRIIQGFNTGDELASDTRTWTKVAPSGYKELLRSNAFKVFLVITDDRVSCSYGGYTFSDLSTAVGGELAATTFDSALRGLSATHFGTASARNYKFHSIVGMAENNPGATPWPATAAINTSRCSPGSEAPGTGYQALSRLTGGLRYPICRNDDFNAIFQAVAAAVVEGASVSCSIQLGNSAEADPDKTSVRFTAGTGTTTTFTRVADAGACSNDAYYYADATTITLCPSTCTAVQGDTGGTLGVEVGCKNAGGYETKVLTETYESECNEDARVQWGFLTYDTTTPGDSSVSFRIRTAPTEGALAAAQWLDVATASRASNNQRCAMSGPAPCPIDLFTLLGGKNSPAVRHPYAQVEVTLTPSSDGLQPAAVQGWELNYSCPFAQ